MPSMFTDRRPALSPEAFAMLGAGDIAYVTTIRSEDVGFIHAEAPLLPPGRWVFVLNAADGSPLAIAGSLESVVADAERQRLDTVSVH